MSDKCQGCYTQLCPEAPLNSSLCDLCSEAFCHSGVANRDSTESEGDDDGGASPAEGGEHQRAPRARGLYHSHHDVGDTMDDIHDALEMAVHGLMEAHSLGPAANELGQAYWAPLDWLQKDTGLDDRAFDEGIEAWESEGIMKIKECVAFTKLTPSCKQDQEDRARGAAGGPCGAVSRARAAIPPAPLPPWSRADPGDPARRWRL